MNESLIVYKFNFTVNMYIVNMHYSGYVISRGVDWVLSQKLFFQHLCV